MPRSKNIAAYVDEPKVFRQALTAIENGGKLTLTFETRAHALRFRKSCHSYRQILRQERGGVTPFEHIVISHDEKKLIFDTRQTGLVKIEGLEELAGETDIADFDSIGDMLSEALKEKD